MSKLIKITAQEAQDLTAAGVSVTYAVPASVVEVMARIAARPNAEVATPAETTAPKRQHRNASPTTVLGATGINKAPGVHNLFTANLHIKTNKDSNMRKFVDACHRRGVGNRFAYTRAQVYSVWRELGLAKSATDAARLTTQLLARGILTPHAR